MEERRVEAGLGRGHAVLPHTAAVIVEGWGASKVAAFAEVAQAMVDVFAETTGAEATEPLPVSIAAGPDDEMLVALLEEVIFVAEVFAKVPVDIRLEETEEGGLVGLPRRRSGRRGVVHRSRPQGGVAFRRRRDP